MPIGKARVLMATAGTWGDLLPFVELGRRLRSRGHEVTMACSTGLHPWVERAGLKAEAFDGDFGKEKAQKNAKDWDQWSRSPETSPDSRYAALANQFERNCRDLAALAAQADLLLSPTNCPEGGIVHRMTGVPWYSVVFIPEEIFRPRWTDDERFIQVMNSLFQRLGLSDTFSTAREKEQSAPVLFACSRALGKVEDPRVQQTGFWFYEDPDWTQWQPEDRLLRFMQDGEAPLVLSFSSLPLENPRKVLEVHVRAARLLGRRLVIQQGWSGFSRELLPPDVDPGWIYMADFLPHDWFFSRAAGLITHGGAGTLGRALRNGCPVLVEPYGNDQFFNALLMKRLGYGVAVHPHRLTAESLARVIRESLLAPGVRERVVTAASIIRDEDGVGRACAIIEKRLEEVAA